MSVAIIKKIARRIFSSLYSVIVFIVFISTVSVYITLDLNNDKNDNNGKDDEDIWRKYEDVKKKKVTPSVSIDHENPNTYFHLRNGLILYVTCCIILALILNYCCRWDCIRGSLEISYNWLFRRNQARENEPAVRYRRDRIYWIGQQSMHSFEYSSDEEL